MAGVQRRAAVHAALGEPARLAIVEELAVTDRSPKELGERIEVASNLLAHHLSVLEAVGLIQRITSSGDGRRRYVRLLTGQLDSLIRPRVEHQDRMVFIGCHDAARAPLAAALWTARSGRPAVSVGLRPVGGIDPRTVAAARRAGLDLPTARSGRHVPLPVDRGQVVTVCDRVHEQLDATASWWHWSVPDPALVGTDAAFDAVVADLDTRITALLARG